MKTTKRKDKDVINNIRDNVLQKIKDLDIEISNANEFGNTTYFLKDKDNQTIIDLAYASLNSRNEYFYGIETKQFDTIYSQNRNSFQIFICENENTIFIVPLSVLIEILKDKSDNTEQFKPVIKNRNGIYTLRFFGNYELTEYFNRFDLLKQEELPQKSKKEKIKIETEIEIIPAYQKIYDLISEDKLSANSTHGAVIQMLKHIGEWYGFKVFTEARPLHYDDFPYQIDCLWYKDDDIYLAIEVCDKGSIEKDKDALKQVKTLGARKVIIVTDISKMQRIRKLFMYNGEIKSWTEVWSFDRILKLYETGRDFYKDFSKFRRSKWNENILEYL
ncbi:MAG: hypothetical protein QM536_04585 [Chitinophagaceae bacterium]|nr:hypothetical protein [Chitinophagaceae bacterium]